MNFDLSEEQQILQKAVRDLCERLIIPNAAKWDREERFPHEVIAPMAENDRFMSCTSQKFACVNDD